MKKRILLLLLAIYGLIGLVQAGSYTTSGTTLSSCITVSVPRGSTNIVISLSMTGGDWDLYVRTAACPTTNFWDCRPYITGTTTEVCNMGNAPGTCGTGTQNYYVMVNPWTVGGTWTLTATWTDCPFSPPPVNDECTGAISLTPGASCSYSAYTNAYATASAGIPAPGCGNYLGGDVWFSVVVPASGNLIIDSQTGGMLDGGMAAYSGTCGALTLIECDDDDSPNGLMPRLELSGLTPGSTIYIRFWEYGNNNNGTFSICAIAPAGSGPCASIIPIICNTNYNVTLSNGGQWNSSICGVGTPGGEVIASYTPTVSGSSLFNITAFSGTASGMTIAYQSGSCSSSGWQCISHVNSIGYYGPIALTAGQTYYFLFENGSASSQTMSFSFTCPETPGNYVHPTVGLQGTYLGACMVNTCSGVYTDNGGIGPYSNNINSIYRTFCPDAPGKCIRATVNDLTIESSSGCANDALIIRNGPTQGSPFLWGGCGSWGATVPTQISTDPSGCLTFVFYSNSSVTAAGWNITLDCIDCSTPSGNNDCITATAICGATNMADASTGPGITSTCGGCNLSENYSNWYYFEITESGRLEIDLKPENLFEDYDFALYQTDNCNSLGVPVRCSYAMAPTYCKDIWGWLYYLYDPPGPTGPGWYVCASTRYISNVTFSTINNTTGDNGYASYYNTVPTISTGTTYTISVTVAGGTANYCRVYFDWNKDLDFNDAGETYVVCTGAAAGTYTVNIPVPLTARGGKTGFRVINQLNSAPVSCPPSSDATCFQGEIEDYSIFISDGTHCSNGIKDADEEGVDCGGADCVPCTSDYWPTNTGMNSTASDFTEDVSGDSWVNGIAVNAGESYYLMINNWSPGANGFDIVFEFSEGGAMDCSILPVELLEFSARKTGEGVMVDWTTLSELNCDRFEVLKSYDAGIWKNIGMVKGAGNSSSPIRYSLYDSEPLVRTTYFRLKQVDYDGQLSYSGIVAVSPDGEIPLKDLKASYDYVSDQIIISFISPPGMNFGISAGNISGNIIWSDKGITENAKTQLIIPAKEFTNGMYFIKLNGKDYQLTSKLIIVR